MGIHVMEGFFTRATADGRKAMEPISNSLSPVNKVAPFGESGTLRDTKNAKQGEECQFYNRGVVASFDEAMSWLVPAECHGTALPKGLKQAAMAACSGLKVTPGQFLAELDPADHPEIITDPEQARAFAVALDGRLQ